MMNLKNLLGLFLVSLLCFTACKKEAITPENTITAPPKETNTTTPNAATQTRAMAAAASIAHSRNNENLDTMTTDCGCYDLFDGIDFDAPHDEVESAVEAAVAGLSEAEITRIFEPVCTDDGEIYESACIADCEGISNYHTCSEEELEDYFFGDFDCEDFENLTFPAEIELPDGTMVTVNSEEELFDLIDKWYEEFGDELEDAWEEWEDELEDAWEEYEDELEDLFEDCFTFIYPIQVEFPGGEIITYDTEEALYTGIDAWYDANEDSHDDPLLVYPFDVLLSDSTTLTVNNEQEEDVLWESCFGDYDLDICFDLNFPVAILYPDNSTLTVEDETALYEAVDAYYEANEDSEEDVNFVYPIDITLEDGTNQTINNEDELESALENCFEGSGRIAQQSKKSALSGKRVMKASVLKGQKAN